MKMKKLGILLLALLLIAIPVLANEATEQNTETEEEQIAVIVNGQEITVSEVDQAIQLNQLIQQLMQVNQEFVMIMYQTEAGQELINEYRKANLEDIIVEELLAQKVAEENITLSEERETELFNMQVDSILQRNQITEEELLESLSEEGIESMEDFKEIFLTQNEEILKITELQHQVLASVEVTEEEIENYYEANIDNYKYEAGIEVSHILVETEEKAEEILAALNEGADFAELAQENSIDQRSAVNGGNMGWVPNDVTGLDENFKNAAFALEVGEISDIVKSGEDYGYHIIKVTDKREDGTSSFEEVKESIKSTLMNQKERQAMEAYIERLKEEAKIERLL
ncbi:MAG: peptidyl-prolyl cis-trans isomerase [Halanaerobiales bacterium]